MIRILVWILLLFWLLATPSRAAPAFLVKVIVTAYNPVPEQTDDTPLITASNKRAQEGMVALSRDLERNYGFRFGDEVRLLNVGVFVFEDRMNRRWKRRVDLLMFCEKRAKKFGKKRAYLIVE